METTFDFRIKQQAYKAALDIYEELGALLEEEVTRQTEAGQTIGGETMGETTVVFQKGIRDFHTNGIYGEACNKIKELCRIMKDALVEINALLVRCEGFADQLKNSAYVEPVRPMAGDDRVWNGGILALDYDKIAGIKNLCDDITDDNLHIKWQLESIIADYGHLVPEIKSYAGYVDSASGKLNRIQNFKDSFQEYESGIRALEYDLTIQLSNMTEPFGALNLIPENLKGNTIFKIEQLENIFSISYITGNEEWKEITEEYILRGDDAVIRMLAQQIFSRDDADWTEGQIYFIAQTLDYAVQNDKTDMISMYVENLLEEKYVWKSSGSSYYGGNTWDNYNYVVEGKREIIQTAMSCLDVKEQGKTYYTLNRILQTAISGGEVSINRGSMALERPEPYGNGYDVEAKLEDGEIELIISAGRDKNNDRIAVAGSFEMTLTDLGDISGVRLVNDLFFTEEQVEQMRLSAVTDADVEMLKQLFTGRYKEAFDVPVEQLGYGMQQHLVYFGVHLCGLLENVKAGEEPELQKFINGILYVDEERCCWGDYEYFPEDYLKLLTVNTGLVRDLQVASLLYGDISVGEDEEYYRDLSRMYSLWYSLYDIMMEGEIKSDNSRGVRFSYGECYVELSNLQKESDVIIGYDLSLYRTNDNNEVLISMTSNSKVEWNTTKAAGDYIIHNAKTIKQEIETLWLNSAVDTIIEIACVYNPTIGYIIKGISNQLGGGTARDLIANGTKIPEVKNKLGNEGRIASVVLQNILCYKADEERIRNGVVKTYEDNMQSWFFSANLYNTDDEQDTVEYIVGGIYDPDVIRGIITWNTEGIGPMLVAGNTELLETEMRNEYIEREKKVLEEISSGMYDLSKLSEEEWNAVLFMVFGKNVDISYGYTGNFESILQISPELFASAVDVIDEGITKRTVDDESVVPSLKNVWNNFCGRKIE